jgi:hypothetical protein
VALLVEVADSTYPEASGKFLRRYAFDGIAQYWIVNIDARRVEVYTEPQPAREAYGSRTDSPMGALVPLTLGAGDAVRAFEGLPWRKSSATRWRLDPGGYSE